MRDLLVSLCLKPGQPRSVISGLKQTFIKRYIVERTSKAEIRPEEQSEKMREREREKETDSIAWKD